MKTLNCDMILPKFREYSHFHEAGSKPELILFWVRNIVAVYREKTRILIDSSDIGINKMNRIDIDIVVVGNHGQGVLRFSIKILYIMNSGKRCESI